MPNYDDRLDTFEGRLGILLQDTKVENPYVITVSNMTNISVMQKLDKGSVSLNKNDLIMVFDQDSENYRIEVPYGELPRVKGYINKNLVSFDEELFSKANQGYVDRKNLSYEFMGESSEETMIGAIEIEERRDGWVSFLPNNGGSIRWIKEVDLSYDFPTTVYDYELTK